jgi:hypothetical protein
MVAGQLSSPHGSCHNQGGISRKGQVDDSSPDLHAWLQTHTLMHILYIPLLYLNPPHSLENVLDLTGTSSPFATGITP